MNNPIDVLQGLVKKERQHPGPTCIYVASHRDKYGDIPFIELIPLALYATVPDLERLGSHEVKQLAQIASQRHQAKNKGKDGGLIKALFKYCKNVDSQQQAAALFEGAIDLMENTIDDKANSISPKTAIEDIEHWVLISRAHLHRLHLINTRANDKYSNAPHHPEEALFLTAMQANVGLLKGIFGDFLHVGFNTSSVRKEEANQSFTKAVHLHMPLQEGEDFRLEIRIGLGAGMAIEQLISAGDDLYNALGNFLYKGTKSSKTKPPVQLTWVDMDCKLELMLGFKRGSELFLSIFPPV
ncbi:hypothetical protein QBC38DRAFT_493913 [Podospora fimiseda]|uniref:Uncharacterized protein n=1 Tax=Podospora fimiseda TaxID=252190 RepID=A0AAN7BEA5_9PEZI|nr:hypothetical protein QBC38DRAFT_493913 [Podospora fimiseda]